MKSTRVAYRVSPGVAASTSTSPHRFEEVTAMPFSIAMIGAGQFAGSFAHLFHLHPGVTKVYATDVIAERADDLVARHDLAGTFASFDEVLASPEIDAVAIFTQRWSHGPLVVQALRAGKHVYSAVPMAISAEEI